MWPGYRFKITKPRKKALAYILGSQQMKKRTFPLNLQALQIAQIIRNTTIGWEHSGKRDCRRRVARAGSSDCSPTSARTGKLKALPKCHMVEKFTKAVSFLAFQNTRLQEGGTYFCTSRQETQEPSSLRLTLKGETRLE